mmetsp:Transcript_26304/g.42148  ORF Transcript_26304/g.42148 Transcript_26304/m.42148 type:complete len:81 (+) Transcript_26304:486-728(+)
MGCDDSVSRPTLCSESTAELQNFHAEGLRETISYVTNSTAPKHNSSVDCVRTHLEVKASKLLQESTKDELGHSKSLIARC